MKTLACRRFAACLSAALTLWADAQTASAAEPPKPHGPVPSARQLAWHELEFYGFIHFTVNTFTDREWGFGDEKESVFHPTAFDADQIVRACKDGGMKGLILTAKHHDGFCLWPSKYTEHSVKNSPWKNGKGDVVKEFAAACQKNGLKFGIYISPWDRDHAEYGRPAYVEYYKNQIRELLTQYGPVFEMWFDGASGGDGYYGGQGGTRKIDYNTYYDWKGVRALIRELQPQCAVWCGQYREGEQLVYADCQWGGSEGGDVGDPCWHTLNSRKLAVGIPDYQHGHREGDVWCPAEGDVSIRPGWFYHASQDNQVKSPEQLMAIYFSCVGRGANLILNVPPDRRGQAHANDVKSLQGFGKRMAETFGTDLTRNGNATASHFRGQDPTFGPANLIDGRRETYWATDDGVTTPEVVLGFTEPVTFNIVRLREHLPLGQRIDDWELDVWQDDQWREFAKGTAIGACRLVRSAPHTTTKIRLRITKAAACPAISEFALFAEPVHQRQAQIRSDAPSNAILSGTVPATNPTHGDKPARDLSAAALARPSPQQYAWHEQERIQFVCLDPCTWQGREYDNHSTPLSAINPDQLDTDQWCRAAKLWGAKEILFVAKHTGGFCWWQTETTKYGIKDAAWKGGKGDVLAELSASCRKHDLTLGIYVYPGDDTWGAPMGSGGRTKDPTKQEAYNKVFRQQLTEVLTRYGKITEVWFDGSCVIDVSDILKRHAADAVVFQGPQATIRWPGTESGRLPYPAWNSLRSKDLKTGVATAAHGSPDGDAWAPLEADTTLYNHNWFWAAANETKRKSLDELLDIYYKSAGHGGVLLLNSTPNTNGLIPDGDLKLYAAFGQEIERRFSRPVAEVKDHRGSSVELALPQPTLVNHAVIMEDYREGERIREYVVDGFSDGQWRELKKGTSVGRKKIDLFRPTRVNRVRLHATTVAAEPVIRSLAVFYVEGLSAGSLTTGRPTTASTVHSAPYIAPMATDDDPQTRWGCPDGTTVCWLEVDLGAPTTFGRVAIHELADRIRKFTLQYRSDTNAPWRSALEGARVGARFQKDFPAVTGRFARLNITEASGPPTIWEFHLHLGAQVWQRCSTWTPQSFREGRATLTLDLSPFILKPGQFEVMFEQTGGTNALRITKATLIYEGEEATPALLTRLAAPNTFNVNRTAQVTKETSSVLRAEITAEVGSDCAGAVWIRCRPTE